MRILFLLSGLLLGLLSQQVQAQNCNTAVQATAPTTRYSLFTDGTALDKQTGLMWMRCSLGQTWQGNTCQGSDSALNWQTALQTAETMVFAGKSDWRLPNIKELKSLRELSCYSPAINITAFPTSISSTWFWSSSPSPDGYNNAWGLNFDNGNDDYDGRHNGYLVRLVRGGQ